MSSTNREDTCPYTCGECLYKICASCVMGSVSTNVNPFLSLCWLQGKCGLCVVIKRENTTAWEDFKELRLCIFLWNQEHWDQQEGLLKPSNLRHMCSAAPQKWSNRVYHIVRCVCRGVCKCVFALFVCETRPLGEQACVEKKKFSWDREKVKKTNKPTTEKQKCGKRITQTSFLESASMNVCLLWKIGTPQTPQVQQIPVTLKDASYGYSFWAADWAF